MVERPARFSQLWHAVAQFTSSFELVFPEHLPVITTGAGVGGGKGTGVGEGVGEGTGVGVKQQAASLVASIVSAFCLSAWPEGHE